ncbi:MAG: hypothetical protein ACRD3E_10750 [Terriglobales bacterium]
MFTFAMIVVAAVAYFALLGLTLAFLAGATRASDRLEPSLDRRVIAVRRHTRLPYPRRAA